MPEAGYTAIVRNILAEFAQRIDIRLGAAFEGMPETFDHVFYTGPLDRYFVFRLGRLGTYRYLDMDATIHEALLACEQIESILASNGAQALPVFFTPRP